MIKGSRLGFSYFWAVSYTHLDVYKRQSYDRTVGTQKESLSRERENRCKRGRSRVGKSARQSEDVKRSELK